MNILLLAATISVAVTDPRQPSPCPDGSRVVLCWRGDLWEAPGTGGVIRCLTPSPSFESFPAWSPDGSLVAFTSDRSGGGDVYVMPAGGGEATRLTWYGGFDQVVGWSPGSDSVYFRSDREASPGWIYSAPVSGGAPGLLLAASVEGVSRSPSGLLAERGFTEWWRRHYSGSASRDVWSVEGGEWLPAACSPLDERWPLWVDGTGLVFVMEDQAGNANFHAAGGADGLPVPLTSLDGGDVTFPALSADSRTIFFEYRGGLWRLDTGDWLPVEVPLDAAVDDPFPRHVETTVGTFTDEYSILSDSCQAALTAEGELFCGLLGPSSGITGVERLTDTPGREGSPAWSPDGTMLAFTREHDGRSDLVLMGPADPDTGFVSGAHPSESVLPVEGGVAENPCWSPDGRYIAYLDRESRLRVMEIATRRDREVCPVPGLLHVSWSPDSRWLAFSVTDLAHREDVFVVSASGGRHFNVSRHPNDDFQPFWPSDGRRLVFASRTDEGEWSLRQVWLTREDFGASRDEREELLDEPAAEVEIDFDDLARRTETLCTVEGYYDFYGASRDGRTFAFRAYDKNGGSDLWKVEWDGSGLERLTFASEEPSDISITSEGTVFYLGMGDVLRSVGSNGTSPRVLTWRSRTDWVVTERQAQKFDECWRLLRDNFYDPGMHGADWDSVRVRYRERASRCLLNEDFNEVVRRMLGELDASHLGIYGPWSWSGGAPTGEIGIIVDHSWGGPGVRVDSVIPWSPAGMPRSRLFPGDLVLSVDGVEVGPHRDIYEPLAGKVGEEVALEVRRNGAIVSLTLEPVSAWELSDLAYDEWVARNRRIVSLLTGDRIGYLHISSMDQSSVETFLGDLFAEGMDRDGMIIDVRGNGGGSTHDQILRELSRPEYLVSRYRGGRLTAEPLGAWQKPVVLLINERCYSDAEIFPAGWKALGIGPIVGNTTFGAVIGTSDTELLDGTGFRVPSEGWYTLDGVDLENYGVQPDIRVLEMPADYAAGADRQLEEAARVVMRLVEGE